MDRLTNLNDVQIQLGGEESGGLGAFGSIPGVLPLMAGGRCGAGVGSIRSGETGLTLQWRAPGSEVYGQAVTVSGDGDYDLQDGEDPDAWIRLRVWMNFLNPYATEGQVELYDVFNNAPAGPDIEAGEAETGGQPTHVCQVVNCGSQTAYDVLVWLEERGLDLEISLDGTTWAAPMSETDPDVLDLGDLPAGQGKTMYLRRTVPVGCDAAGGVLSALGYAWMGV